MTHHLKEAAQQNNKKKMDDCYSTHETNIREEIHFSHSSQLLHSTRFESWLHHLFFCITYDQTIAESWHIGHMVNFDPFYGLADVTTK